ncbi:peptidoglycan-binding protein [Streptomyces sp. NPDC004266]|uniref:peptidoglycan-binding domain-containing protein n=1 Tax=Streptomyces sp. NPDC004266 TaxID=3364693 RepID=UPI0036764207
MPAAAGTGGEEIAVVRPVPSPAAAPVARTGRVAQLAIVFLTLLVALLLGRWAVMNGSGKDDTATPPATTETQPGDSSDTDDADAAQPPADTPPPADGPTAGDGKAEDLQADGPAAPGHTETPAPGASSTGNNTAPPAQQAPSDGAGSTPGTTPTAPAASPPRTAPAPTTAPATSPASLGAEGRTACAHYKPNRRVILAEGMVGTNVAQVQCLLNHNYDYHLNEDGKFGPATTAGVKAIQQCSGITADGKVGPDTWKYLDYPKAACGH